MYRLNLARFAGFEQSGSVRTVPMRPTQKSDLFVHPSGDSVVVSREQIVHWRANLIVRRCVLPLYTEKRYHARHTFISRPPLQQRRFVCRKEINEFTMPAAIPARQVVKPCLDEQTG